MIVADIVTLLIPVFILVGLLILLIALNLLARVKGGKYVRPIAMGLMKVPFLKRWLQKASKANLERKNPELASAVVEAAAERGLLLLKSGIYSNCIRVLCPLVLTDAELDEALEVWEDALGHAVGA